MQTQKIDAEKWGAKVIEQISTDLQKQHWGLKRFFYRNLMKMKQFYTDHQPLSILPSALAELAKYERGSIYAVCNCRITHRGIPAFWLISFSHHILLLGKYKTNYKRLFYVAQATYQYCLVMLLPNY